MPVNEHDLELAKRVYEDSIKPAVKDAGLKFNQETFEEILNKLYGVIGGKDESRQLSILEALTELSQNDYNELHFMQKGALSVVGAGLTGAQKVAFDNLFSASKDKRKNAENLLNLILTNSPVALLHAAESIETNTPSTDTRSIRSDSSRTMFSDDEDSVSSETPVNDYNSVVDDEIAKLQNKEISSYEMALRQLNEYSRVLLVIVKNNEVNQHLKNYKHISNELMRIDSYVFKELKKIKHGNSDLNIQSLIDDINLVIGFHGMLVAKLGEGSTHVKPSAAQLKAVNLKSVKTSEAQASDTKAHDVPPPEASQSNKSLFSKALDLAKKIINALSDLIGCIFKIKECIERKFSTKKVKVEAKVEAKLHVKEETKHHVKDEVNDESKKMLIFMAVTGLNKRDAKSIFSFKEGIDKTRDALEDFAKVQRLGKH